MIWLVLCRKSWISPRGKLPGFSCLSLSVSVATVLTAQAFELWAGAGSDCWPLTSGGGRRGKGGTLSVAGPELRSGRAPEPMAVGGSHWVWPRCREGLAAAGALDCSPSGKIQAWRTRMELSGCL